MTGFQVEKPFGDYGRVKRCDSVYVAFSKIVFCAVLGNIFAFLSRSLTTEVFSSIY